MITTTTTIWGFPRSAQLREIIFIALCGEFLASRSKKLLKGKNLFFQPEVKCFHCEKAGCDDRMNKKALLKIRSLEYVELRCRHHTWGRERSRKLCSHLMFLFLSKYWLHSLARPFDSLVACLLCIALWMAKQIFHLQMMFFLYFRFESCLVCAAWLKLLLSANSI